MTLQNPKPSEEAALRNFSFDFVNKGVSQRHASWTMRTVDGRTINFPRKTPSTTHALTVSEFGVRTRVQYPPSKPVTGDQLRFRGEHHLITQPATLTLLCPCIRFFRSCTEVGAFLVGTLADMAAESKAEQNYSN